MNARNERVNPNPQATGSIAERMDNLDPTSKRFAVLVATVSFKKHWTGLARELATIRGDGTFKEWGCRTFEAYAQHELQLPRETAKKLITSYTFLRDHEQTELGRSRTEDHLALPSFHALDILAEARGNPAITEADYREIRDAVFRDDPTPAHLRKLVKEKAPPPVKATKDDPTDRLRRCLTLAERLYGMLLEEEVPDSICTQVEKTVGGLRRLLED